ncbi:MAG: hypothetical protein KJZ69_15715 [Phycisphaerales bacterium]|nr:hypothetical protein [Phycisphaerales bacterium]
MSKSRENSRVGGRSSGIALLAASTIVLAAAGETMWHANASASACEGRWAGPGVGAVPAPAATTTVPASNGRTEGSAAASAAHELHEEAAASEASTAAQSPSWDVQFRPFVLVRIPYDQTTYPDGGEVLGVSNHGQQLKAIAVGYLRDDYAAAPQPFMFTAATNTVAMLDMDGGAYDHGAATSISPDGSIIAGWAYHPASDKYLAVVWKASTGYQIDATLSPSTDSHWNAVNNGGVPAGAYYNSGDFQSVVGDSTPGYPYSGSAGETKGINASKVVCGWYDYSTNVSHAYRWDAVSGGLDLHPSGSGYGPTSGANCINTGNDIGGWVMNLYGKRNAAHWKPMSLPGVIYQTEVLWGSGEIASYEIVAINSNREMLVERVDDVPGIALWTNNSLANKAFLIDTAHSVQGAQHLILMPNPDDHIYNGHCLNDDLWIGGSYLVHGEGLPRPCLAIPYDVDNNGNPDYRDIVESGVSGSGFALDHAGFEWLLDAGENIGYAFGGGSGIRVGLNSPGYSDDTNEQGIANTQVVRLPLGIHRPDFASAGEEEFYVNGILDSGQDSQCSAFQSGINLWREGREIVLMLRSNLDADGDPDHDYLPTAPNADLGGLTKDDLLTNLHWFGYKFARCVDWIQLGNEAFSSSDLESVHFGHGGYKIWKQEVELCWTSGADPREFEDIPCPITAINAVQAWHWEQMWPILEGSALAGRPLRIVGPAITMGTIEDSYEDDTTMGYKAIDRTARWCNDYQVWFDMHARYLSHAAVEGARAALMGSGNPSWQPPYHAVCLEFAPELDDTIEWWTSGGSERFDQFLNMPACNDPPGITWEQYIAGQVNSWKSAQFQGDFGLDEVAYYFWYDEFTVICYGSTLQLPASDPLWDLAALRAQNVCDEYILDENKFSPLKGDYVSAAAQFWIDEFDPHQAACSACGGN